MSNIQMKFSLGQVCATPGALATMEEAYGKRTEEAVRVLFVRHGTGDWGDMCEEDKAANDLALIHGTRIFSGYILPPAPDCKEGEKLWLITEADRSSSTLLRPDEY